MYRPSIWKCSHSFSYSLVILLRRQRVANCELPNPSFRMNCGVNYVCSLSDWDRIKSPAADQIIPYESLKPVHDPKIFNKLAVLKVNGGLGTSMGECRHPLLRMYR